jgi:hypothetical protein
LTPNGRLEKQTFDAVFDVTAPRRSSIFGNQLFTTGLYSYCSVNAEISETVMSMSIAAVGGPSSLGIVSGASGAMPPNQKMTSLFNSIDTSGSGSITQAQFNQAFQTLNPPAVFKAQGADAIWNSLDPQGTGSVSKQNFVNAMKDLMVKLRADSTGTASQVTPGQTLDSSLQSLNILA